MENLFVLFENLQAAQAADDIGKENAEEGSDQRSRSPRISGGSLIDPMVLTTPSTAATIPGQRVGQIVLRLVHLVEMRFHRIV